MINSVLETSGPNSTRVIAFVGGSCSLATEPTAALSGRLYKVVQVSCHNYTDIKSFSST